MMHEEVRLPLLAGHIVALAKAGEEVEERLACCQLDRERFIFCLPPLHLARAHAL